MTRAQSVSNDMSSSQRPNLHQPQRTRCTLQSTVNLTSRLHCPCAAPTKQASYTKPNHPLRHSSTPHSLTAPTSHNPQPSPSSPSSSDPTPLSRGSKTPDPKPRHAVLPSLAFPTNRPARRPGSPDPRRSRAHMTLNKTHLTARATCPNRRDKPPPSHARPSLPRLRRTEQFCASADRPSERAMCKRGREPRARGDREADRR
jgi:hypothetical protein